MTLGGLAIAVGLLVEDRQCVVDRGKIGSGERCKRRAMRHAAERDKPSRLDGPMRLRTLRKIGDGARQRFARPMRARKIQYTHATG